MKGALHAQGKIVEALAVVLHLPPG